MTTKKKVVEMPSTQVLARHYMAARDLKLFFEGMYIIVKTAPLNLKTSDIIKRRLVGAKLLTDHFERSLGERGVYRDNVLKILGVE